MIWPYRLSARTSGSHPEKRGSTPLRATIEAKSYFVYDKEKYANEFDKPLGLGIVYTKPDGTKTQDIIMVHPVNGITVYYRDTGMMIKDYPSMKGVHKKNLPI